MSLLLALLYLLLDPTENLGSISDPVLQDRQPAHDVYCGARALHFVLQFYQKSCEDDLFNLVQNLSSDDTGNGVPLSSLREVLNQRNVFAEAVYIAPMLLTKIRWRYPIIVHMRDHDLGSRTGHYIVWLPTSTSNELHIVNGLSGEEVPEIGSLIANMSGNILITSSEPIDRAEVAKTLIQESSGFNICWVFVGILLTALSTVMLTPLLNIRQKRLD